MGLKEAAIAHWDNMGRTRQWSALYSRVIDSRNVHVVTRKRRTLDMLRAEQPGHVLDVGCGPGVLVPELLDMGFDYLGMDLAEGMLVEAREMWRENERVQYQRGDIERIPATDAAFQAITCLGVIEYVPDLDAAIGEMYRVLRPGGVTIVSNHNRVHVDTIVIAALTPVRWLLLPLVRRLRKERPDDLRRQLLGPGELDDRMTRAGFALDDFALYHFTPLPYPFTVLVPRVAHFVNRRFERFYHRRGMAFLAHGYIGKYRKVG